MAAGPLKCQPPVQHQRHFPQLALLTLTAAVSLAVSPSATRAAPQREQTDLWTASEGGYALYRIPVIVVAPGGSLLAFCEARSGVGGDWGKINILMRRSTDDGKSWDAPRRIVEPPADAEKSPVAIEQKLGKPGAITMNNPVAIADPAAGAVHLLYCVEYARCFYVRSEDDGKSFGKPVEITATFEAFRKDYPWRVLATGPGHAIRLATGRLVVPVWLSTAAGGARGHGHRPSCVATIYSDDAGRTWKAGDMVANDPNPLNPSEASVAELSDGRVMINVRHEGVADAPATKDRPTWRGVSISPDGATKWSPVQLDRGLPEPVCMGSLLRVDADGKPRLLFSNPDNSKDHRRRNLTVRMSDDDGRTWPVKRVIDPGVSGYSDLAASADTKWIYCFYERGTTTDDRHNDIAALTVVRFNLDWLTAETTP
jgi:sialidase-1